MDTEESVGCLIFMVPALLFISLVITKYDWSHPDSALRHWYFLLGCLVLVTFLLWKAAEYTWASTGTMLLALIAWGYFEGVLG